MDRLTVLCLDFCVRVGGFYVVVNGPSVSLLQVGTGSACQWDPVSVSPIAYLSPSFRSSSRFFSYFLSNISKFLMDWRLEWYLEIKWLSM